MKEHTLKSLRAAFPKGTVVCFRGIEFPGVLDRPLYHNEQFKVIGHDLIFETPMLVLFSRKLDAKLRAHADAVKKRGKFSEGSHAAR